MRYVRPVRTPGHVTINLALLGSSLFPDVAWPILLGAMLPDIPIFVLYLRERHHGTPEEVIWSDHYRRRFWQDLVHGLHSMPLALGGALLAWWSGQASLVALFSSMFLHALCDLPVHGEDAHRHFLPLSHYRFISPLSYWDVRRHGQWVAAAEGMLVLCASLVLWPRMQPGRVALPAHIALILVNLWYVQHWIRAYMLPLLRARTRAT